jgi:hypothetical protein
MPRMSATLDSNYSNYRSSYPRHYLRLLYDLVRKYYAKPFLVQYLIVQKETNLRLYL